MVVKEWKWACMTIWQEWKLWSRCKFRLIFSCQPSQGTGQKFYARQCGTLSFCRMAFPCWTTRLLCREMEESSGSLAVSWGRSSRRASCRTCGWSWCGALPLFWGDQCAWYAKNWCLAYLQVVIESFTAYPALAWSWLGLRLGNC